MVTLEEWGVIPEEVRPFICIHRGLFIDESEENTATALSRALKLNPYMLEFDIQYLNGCFYAGHPPHIIKDRDGELEHILKVYCEHSQLSPQLNRYGRTTFAKIDVKLPEEGDYETIINTLLDILGRVQFKSIQRILVNLGGKCFVNGLCMDVETYFVEQVKKRELISRVKLNIDLDRYIKIGNVQKHVSDLSHAIYSMSPEINESNWQDILVFAKKHGIDEIHFWLRGLPNVVDPCICVSILQKALRWGQKNKIKVYFDINPKYIDQTN